MPQAQDSLERPGGVQPRGFLQHVEDRWNRLRSLPGDEVLFDWADRTALMHEIAFVNEARERLDEAAVKVAPSMLRIVMTVKEHIAEPRAQRAFLAEHVDWDFRRISELCIVADSYALLDPDNREDGEAEIRRYGWSNALKLAYVREPAARAEIWRRACVGKGRASYRAVLEELKRFREGRLIGPPASPYEVSERLDTARTAFNALTAMADDLSSPERLDNALQTVGRLQKDLSQLRRALQERREAVDTESLAANA